MSAKAYTHAYAFPFVEIDNDASCIKRQTAWQKWEKRGAGFVSKNTSGVTAIDAFLIETSLPTPPITRGLSEWCAACMRYGGPQDIQVDPGTRITA